jgi:hypothetical protein
MCFECPFYCVSNTCVSFPICRKYEYFRTHRSHLVRQMCSETNVLLHCFQMTKDKLKLLFSDNNHLLLPNPFAFYYHLLIICIIFDMYLMQWNMFKLTTYVFANIVKNSQDVRLFWSHNEITSAYKLICNKTFSRN